MSVTWIRYSGNISNSSSGFYVLDINQNPVPIGVVGELYIGGTGVVRGYLNGKIE